MQYETVVGFEIHTELLTRSKVFCGCSTAFGQPPNTQTCPVCLGLPGALPVLNREALELSMRAALALNCTITPNAQFERKNYYYPDLPKNYQISQLRRNLGEGGWIEFPVPDQGLKRVRINNAHLEEDAGKNTHHEAGGRSYSLVDLNRTGTALLEIVTEPDLRTLKEIEAFMHAMKALLEYTRVSDCNMHEGRLRFEANISVRPKGEEKLGTKVEIKNLNSMKVVLKCVEAETYRQVELLERGGQVVQETRLWDEAEGITRAMRSKEVAHDYRYFPEPDLTELEIDAGWIERVRAGIPELPEARRRRFVDELGLSEADAGVLTADKAVADYFEAALAVHHSPKAIANQMMTETLRFLNEDPDRTLADYPIAAADLAGLVKLIDEGRISGKIGKQVYRHMMDGEGAAQRIVEARGLVQISDTSAIEPIVDEVIASNPQAVEDLRAGKQRAMGALVGQIMKATQGKANPKLVNEMIMTKIKE